MAARYRIVDVFAREALAGNALAVYPDPGSVEPARMQRIAREMNLSETTFVTDIRPDGYDVRIFTPTEELPFAGHPTLGTAWVLRSLGAVAGVVVVQRGAAGETPVEFEGDRVWLERSGNSGEDLPEVEAVVEVLGLRAGDVGFDWSSVGGASVRLAPAISDAGLAQLMLPIADPSLVASLRAPSWLGDRGDAYCFAPIGPGRIKARFFAPGFGVVEDPATGSAAAALGVYLGARIGAVSVEIEQGAEVGRPSFISLEASPGRARVGGEVRLAAEGALVA